MSRQLIIDNLRYAKRRAKALPDALRVLVGHVSKPIAGTPSLLPLWQPQPVDIRPYRSGSTQFPVSIVTPPDGHFLTTFFDVDPFSPSGRFLAVTQVPFIDRIPIPGDPARVCVIDLERRTCEAVYETVGWGAQLGANVQWGADDDTLFCNDFIAGRGTGMRISRATRTATALDGPIYGVTPGRQASFAPNIEMVNAIIPGYGVPDPLFGKLRQNEKMSATEGIWRTDLQTGKCTLLISLADLVPQLNEQEGVLGGRYYVFNTKVNPQGDRLFAVLFSRQVPMRIGYPVQLVTMRLDGSDVRLAMPDRLWRIGGHHPNWTPDGDHILMNLRHNGGKMAFVRFRFDGSGLEVVAEGHKGSGHPSFHPSQNYLLTDSYISEGFKDESGEVPLRLIDLRTNVESEICRVFTKGIDGPRRVDPHPVWSANGKKVVFNAVVGGFRQVFVADTSALEA